MSKKEATVELTTEEEIQKAIDGLKEEGLIKAEEGDDMDYDDDDDEEGDDEEDTNAKMGDEDGDEDDEEGDDVAKGKKKIKKSFDEDGDEDDDEVAKAIDMHPILKAFDKRMERMESVVVAMSKNSGVVMKGMNEKMNDLKKGMEVVENWSHGRKSMGALPQQRFEKSEGGERMLDPQNPSDKSEILKSLDAVAFNPDNSVKDRAVADAVIMYESSGVFSQPLAVALAKQNTLVKGYGF